MQVIGVLWTEVWMQAEFYMYSIYIYIQLIKQLW